MESTQVGGNHYAAAYQHWDWAMDVNLGYFEAAASKYAFRWYKENGLEDLDKARSYLIKAKEGYVNDRWRNDSDHADNFMRHCERAEEKYCDFVNSAKVPDVEAELCLSIAQWRTDTDLSVLIGLISAHMDAVQSSLNAGGTLGPLAPLTATQRQKTGGSGRAGGTTTQPTASGTSSGVGINHPFPFGYCPGDL
jgi:hypothetical protein